MGWINILPKANTPPNIAPHTNILEGIGGSIMQHLPYGGGIAYDALGTLYHLINGTAGNYGPAPTLPGRIMQYINPNFGAGYQLPVNSETNNPPMYGPAGQPQQQGGLPGPALPAPNAAAPAPQQGGLGPGAYGQAGISMADVQNMFNTGRFTGAPAFSGTLAQAQFPGSMIGPNGGNAYPNPYVGQFTHQVGSDSGQFGSTQAWWGNVLGNTQP